MHQKLCGLAEELIIIGHSRLKVGEVPGFHNARQQLQVLRRYHAGLLVAIDAIARHMDDASQEPADKSGELKRARKLLGDLITAVELEA